MVSGVGERVEAVRPYSTLLEDRPEVAQTIVAVVSQTMTLGVTKEFVQRLFCVVQS